MLKDLVEFNFLVFVQLLWFVHLFIYVNELTTLIVINTVFSLDFSSLVAFFFYLHNFYLPIDHGF
jgi:hypothetical protein